MSASMASPIGSRPSAVRSAIGSTPQIKTSTRPSSASTVHRSFYRATSPPRLAAPGTSPPCSPPIRRPPFATGEPAPTHSLSNFGQLPRTPWSDRPRHRFHPDRRLGARGRKAGRRASLAGPPRGTSRGSTDHRGGDARRLTSTHAAAPASISEAGAVAFRCACGLLLSKIRPAHCPLDWG
jgi:hypothetical protein